MNDEQTYELIERYLAGELSGEELQGFEARLEEDAELRKEVEVAREINVVLADEAGMDFSRVVAEVGEEFFAARTEETSQDSEPSTSSRRRFPTWMAIAASVVLLAVVGYFTLFQGGADPAALYSEYYADYPAPEAFRGDSSLLSKDSTIVEKFEAAFDFYNTGDNANAVPAFQGILEVVPGNQMATFFAGLSAHEAGQFAESETYLKQLAQGSFNNYQQAARWYLALNYLKQDQIDAAKEWLGQLAGPQGKYPKQAAELLDKLD